MGIDLIPLFIELGGDFEMWVITFSLGKNM